MKNTGEKHAYWHVVHSPWLQRPMFKRNIKIWVKIYNLDSKCAQKSSKNPRTFLAAKSNFKPKTIDFVPGSCVIEDDWHLALKWWSESAMFKRNIKIWVKNYNLDSKCAQKSSKNPRTFLAENLFFYGFRSRQNFVGGFLNCLITWCYSFLVSKTLPWKWQNPRETPLIGELRFSWNAPNKI